MWPAFAILVYIWTLTLHLAESTVSRLPLIQKCLQRPPSHSNMTTKKARKEKLRLPVFVAAFFWGAFFLCPPPDLRACCCCSCSVMMMLTLQGLSSLFLLAASSLVNLLPVLFCSVPSRG